MVKKHRTLAQWLECSPMARETWVQSQVESYQRLKKWYLMLPCLTLSIIKYRSRVKWSNPGKGVAPFPIPWSSSYRKGAFGSPSTMVANFSLTNMVKKQVTLRSSQMRWASKLLTALKIWFLFGNLLKLNLLFLYRVCFGRLVCWVLRHINLSRLFNAKSIFM